ncbi:MAG: CvpA family protein [Oscillospiraceae bacterium]|jgi:uncharacterized membrane protein required for colicin V production|nr:CvpA family protein [Oscillospiraceae bacterium]
MRDYIWLFWDLAAVCIIFWCVRACARRGLVRTVIGFLAYVIAAMAARFLSPMASRFIYDKIVKDALVIFVDDRLGDTIASGQDLAVRLVESFPKLLRQYLPLPEQLDVTAAVDTKEIVESLIEAAVREPVLLLLQSLCFIIIFSLVLFVTRYVSRLFTGLYRIPLIGPVNTLLGGVVGLFEAVIFMLLGAFAAGLVIFLSENKLFWLNSDVMDATYIWRFFYRIVAK